jgi:hypothetical protein
MMKLRVFCALVLVSAVTSAPACAYDGHEKDFATCTQGQGKVDNSAVVAACTRLINNSAKENEVVGFFHAMRATANDDKASNCADAHKVLKMTDDPTFVAGAKTLIKVNC